MKAALFRPREQSIKSWDDKSGDADAAADLLSLKIEVR